MSMANSDFPVQLHPDASLNVPRPDVVLPRPTGPLSTTSLVPLRSQESPPIPTLTHYDSLVKGFNTITLAAGFIAAIQGQVMSATIVTSKDNETIALRAINAFFTGGLVLDIMSAMLGYLTGRWLERLTEREKVNLHEYFELRNTHGLNTQPPLKRPTTEVIYCTWMGLSLFVPMPLLIFGIMCMMAGIYTYIWTQHSTVVAALVTLAGAATIPFVIGDFYIGRKDWVKRDKLIRRLSEMQGDW